MSQFLSPRKADLSKAAFEKIASDQWRTHPTSQIAVLFYFEKFIEKSATGEILSIKQNQFGWGAHWISDISEEDIWEVESLQFVVHDGRWEEYDQLRLDVIEGQFHMMRL